MTRNPPDWWARSGALVGIALSIIGLVLTYRNSRWQQAVYEESLEERVLVRTMAWRNFAFKPHSSGLEPDGTIGVEVVNIGIRPLFLKSVTTHLGDDMLTLYEHDPLKPNTTLVKLESGEAGNYTSGADFPKHHLMEESPMQDLIVSVETTKKTFNIKTRIDRVTISGDISLAGFPQPKRR